MNKKKVRITGYAPSMEINPITGDTFSDDSRSIQLKRILQVIVGMRTARKVGDEEVINHTTLGKLQESCIPFEIIS